MCGRYSNSAEFSELKLAFRIASTRLLRPFEPRYNIAPSLGPGYEPVFVTAETDRTRTLRQGRFGYIPPDWSREPKALPSTFNARSEELTQKPFWREPLVTRRCLVPATGWREFVSEVEGKQPYHFVPDQDVLPGGVFAFAGLWSTWKSPDGEAIDSFTILTCAPSAEAAVVHDRMPLVLPLDAYDGWIANDTDPLTVLESARALAATRPLTIRRTDRRANDTRFEGPETIADAPPPKPAPQLSLFGDAPAARGRGRR